MTVKNIFLLLLIVLLGLCIRLFAINWDWGFHLHPDERAIVLFTLPLHFPETIQQFFTPQSPWNPHFFAYGSFPIYLLKILGSFFAYSNSDYNTYDGLTYIGRVISGIFDTGTILVIFAIAKKIFHRNIGLLAAFFYAISVLPIQLSHFYAVDTILTFFITLLLYQLLRFYESPRKKIAISIGILFGFALATKISAIVLSIAILLTISVDFFLIFLKQPHKPKHWIAHTPLLFRRLFLYGFLIIFSAIITFFILEPYAFIDFLSFYDQSMQQAAMTKNAFTFPYTLQYVGKLSYIYEIENSIIWGMGPVLGVTAWLGCIFFFLQISKQKSYPLQKHIIIGSFFLIYFAIIGHFAIGFMRYMLPLYPLLCLFAAWISYSCFMKLSSKSHLLSVTISILFFILISIWPLSFISIYLYPPTRVSASEWIKKNIPKGKTIAIEHWDDALPLIGQDNYTITTLELYNPDIQEKWQKIDQQLAHTDYIILASNRLYVPLQKLTDCTKLPPFYCYKQTANYYKNLFNGSLGFKKIAEFSVYPTIPLLQISFNDQLADESFTVYDHPKVIIFKKQYDIYK